MDLLSDCSGLIHSLTAQVDELQAEVARLKGKLIYAYDRIAAQSEILSRRSERHLIDHSEVRKVI